MVQLSDLLKHGSHTNWQEPQIREVLENSKKPSFGGVSTVSLSRKVAAETRQLLSGRLKSCSFSSVAISTGVVHLAFGGFPRLF